jgi:hypothetical protein
VSLASCVFALRLGGPVPRRDVEWRVARLAELYRPLGEVEWALSWTAGDRIAAGAVETAGRSPDPGGPLAWGSGPPAGLDLIAAGDGELRGLDGPLAAVQLGHDRAVALAAAGGTTALFAAAGPHGAAWSSHAVAAAWLAGLDPRVDPSAVPELLAAEHLSGARTLIEGVRAVAPATRVDVEAEGARESCFWPRTERWSPLPEAEAGGVAERELLRSLERRLRAGVDGPGGDPGAPRPVLGLTAGLDSRVALAALRELGLPVRAFTYGDPAGDDAAGASAAARALGVEHSAAPFAWWPDESGLSAARAEALWSDGARPTGFGDVPWPAMSHWVAGIGGEAGRAFLYRWSHPDPRREPSPEALARVLGVHLGDRLVGADRSVRAAAAERWRDSVHAAHELGVTGWRALDVVYSEERVRRWGRATLPRLDAAALPVFATPELQRALAWLPIEDRLSDGFARRFIAARAPELGTPPARAPRRAPPAPLARRRARQALRGVRRGLRLPRPASAADRWFDQPPWTERPRFVGWLTDRVLTAPLLDSSLGGSWLRATREAFLRGDPAAAELTMQAAAVVALDEALEDLRS